MTNEEHVDIRITRTGKKKTRNILDSVLAVEEKAFPLDDDHECMFETEREYEYVLKKNPILERLKRQEPEEEPSHPEAVPTHSQTLRPVLRDMTEALEQRGEFRIRRYDRGDEVVWVVQIDRQRARFLDRIFTDFIRYLRRALNAD